MEPAIYKLPDHGPKRGVGCQCGPDYAAGFRDSAAAVRAQSRGETVLTEGEAECPCRLGEHS